MSRAMSRASGTFVTAMPVKHAHDGSPFRSCIGTGPTRGIRNRSRSTRETPFFPPLQSGLPQSQPDPMHAIPHQKLRGPQQLRHWISLLLHVRCPLHPRCSTAILISSMIAFLEIEKSTNHHFHRNISRPKSLAKFSPTFSMHALPCRKPFPVLQVGGMPIYSAPPKLDLWDDFRLKRAGQS